MTDEHTPNIMLNVNIISVPVCKEVAWSGWVLETCLPDNGWQGGRANMIRDVPKIAPMWQMENWAAR